MDIEDLFNEDATAEEQKGDELVIPEFGPCSTVDDDGNPTPPSQKSSATQKSCSCKTTKSLTSSEVGCCSQAGCCK